MEKPTKTDSGLAAKLKNHGVAIAAALTIIGCNQESLIVQYDDSGHPLNCWKALGEVRADDGAIKWWDDYSNRPYHIMGNVVSIPVADSLWEAAAQALGIDLSRCTNGRYPSE